METENDGGRTRCGSCRPESGVYFWHLLSDNSPVSFSGAAGRGGKQPARFLPTLHMSEDSVVLPAPSSFSKSDGEPEDEDVALMHSTGVVRPPALAACAAQFADPSQDTGSSAIRSSCVTDEKSEEGRSRKRARPAPSCRLDVACGNAASATVRFAASDVASLCGYHPFCRLDEVFEKYLYQGEHFKLLVEDCKILGLELVSEDHWYAELMAARAPALQPKVEAVLREGLRRDAAGPKVRHAATELARLVRSCGDLESSDAKNLSQFLQGKVRKAYGTRAEERALAQYARLRAADLHSRNSIRLSKDFCDGHFSIRGLVDAIADELVDPFTMKFQSVVVEAKSRLGTTDIQTHRPFFFEEIQVLCYLNLLDLEEGDIVSYVEEDVDSEAASSSSASASASSPLPSSIAVHRVSRTGLHRAAWQEFILPRLLHVTEILERVRQDVELRHRLLLEEQPATKVALLASLIPFWEEQPRF